MIPFFLVLNAYLSHLYSLSPANCTALTLKIERNKNVSNSRNGNQNNHPLLLDYKSHSIQNTTITNDESPLSLKTFDPCRKLIIPAGFMTAGLATWGIRQKVHLTRNRYIKNFHYHYDDYLQYAPSLVVVGLNLSGVKGKHTMARASANYMGSYFFSSSMTHLLKKSIRVLRPDFETLNSFPSGHTATAFGAATFLHKEYGQYRDPKYSILGFGMAVTTGISRQANNRHWISDVLFGAGIGIFSTELSYYLSDRLLSNWGLNSSTPHSGFQLQSDKPSFLQMKGGNTFPISNSTRHNRLRIESGALFGIEGAWFYSKKWGIGGEIALMSHSIHPSPWILKLTDQAIFNGKIDIQSFGNTFLLVGPYFQHSLNSFWSVSAKVITGISIGISGKAEAEINDPYVQDMGLRKEVLKFKPSKSGALSSGFQIHRKISRTVNIAGYIDGTLSQPKIEISTLASIDPATGATVLSPLSKNRRMNYQIVSVGLAITAMLW